MKHLVIISLSLLLLVAGSGYSQSAWDTLFYDDFTDGSSANWML